MTYTIRHHPLVESDLDDIFAFIAGFAGFDAAGDKISHINSHIETLAAFPEIGTVRDEVHPRLRIVTATGSDVICFTVDRQLQDVFIVMVSYAGADWMSRVKNRL